MFFTREIGVAMVVLISSRSWC